MSIRLYQVQHLTDVRDIQKAIQNSRLNFRHLQELDEQAIETGSLVGRYFAVPVADGKAYYQVTRVKKGSVEIMWCDGICLDEYQDRIFGDGGWFQAGIIQREVKRMDGLRSLVGVSGKST